MERQRSLKEDMKLDSPTALNSKERYLYFIASQASVELGSMLVILHQIQKDVYCLDSQDLKILLGRVNGPLESYTRCLRELNLKASELPSR